MLLVPAPGLDVLVLLPGFLIAASAYSGLARSVAASGITVAVPQLYRRGPGALAGRVPVSREARAAADVVLATATERPGARVHLAGHSRGGQAAWVAAGLLTGDSAVPASLLLIDPVDGAGRRPGGPMSTAVMARFTVPTLVVGAALGGRCAPEGVNHEQFVRATPGARHVVVGGLGHADLLNGPSRTLGRWLCGGGADPDAARDAVAELVVDWVAEHR